jgi:hypothetical protein
MSHMTDNTDKPERNETRVMLVVCIVLALLTVLSLIALRALAYAQPLLLPKSCQCPSGYTESGGYCAPMSDRAPIVTE